MMQSVARYVLLLVLAPGAVVAADSARISNPGLTETSGIAASNVEADLFWAVNDSGNKPDLFALDTDGADRGRVRVQGVRNVDWEDLDSFVLDGQSYLLIADAGDNKAVRKFSYLIIVAEPEIGESGRYAGVVQPVSRLAFRYEDGPQDCEAVAVDVASDRILLIGKRRTPAPVYELPLTLAARQRHPLVAHRVGVLGGVPRPTAREMLVGPLGAWRHQPTGLDLRADSSEAAVITYQNVYLYRRASGQTWADALAGIPRVLALPLSQTESIAYLAGHLLAIPEGRFAPLLMLTPPAD